MFSLLTATKLQQVCGHIGEGVNKHGNNIGKFGVGVRNEKGEKILEFVGNNPAATST